MKVLTTIQTICPQCQRVIEGQYIAKNQEVYLEKTCPIHGKFSTFIGPSVSDYLAWTSMPAVNIPPKTPEISGANEKEEGSQCPLHCGLCNNHLQTPCCVLIEITQRCNQHCSYCFASSQEGEDDSIEKKLTLSVIGKKLDRLLELGEERPFNIQFSGGEPTIREDLPDILRLAKSKGFPYLQINTNGKRLAQEAGYAKKLKDAGASVIFLQFDGTDNKVYQELRNEDLWETKQEVIRACREAKLPVTLVPTLVKNINMEEISSMLEFLWKNLDIVAGIHFQPVSFFGRFPGDLKIQSRENKVTLFELLDEIETASQGKIRKRDLLPMSTGHTLCGFHGTFLKEKYGSISLLKDSMVAGEEPENLMKSKNNSSSCCCKNPLDTILRDRGFVLNKWGGKGQQPEANLQKSSPNIFISSKEAIDFDDFLGYIRSNMFTLSAMAFQDLMSLDGERLKRCRVHILAQDDRIIPFCSYNTLYREEDLQKARCHIDSKKTW